MTVLRVVALSSYAEYGSSQRSASDTIYLRSGCNGYYLTSLCSDRAYSSCSRFSFISHQSGEYRTVLR
jgi:hypothetical protein